MPDVHSLDQPLPPCGLPDHRGRRRPAPRADDRPGERPDRPVAPSLDRLVDRAAGALYGLALGDALGMPTQELSRRRAEELLGAGPVLLAGPADNPISHGLRAGSVTDDTEQAVLLGRLLLEGGGRVDPWRLAEELLGWESTMSARGSLDLLGPSTRRALLAVRQGADPATTGREGTTNGAAMRVAPVGVATRDLAEGPDAGSLERAVADACRVTHDTPVARAGALAVATIVSRGVGGADWTEALPAALAAAERVHPPLGAALRAALAVPPPQAAAGPETVAGWLDDLSARVGTTLATEHSVPAAFAVAAACPDDALRAGWWGARLGGDADTIAAMAAAMIGACTGRSRLPAALTARLEAVNRHLDLLGLAVDLVELRTGAPAAERSAALVAGERDADEHDGDAHDGDERAGAGRRAGELTAGQLTAGERTGGTSTDGTAAADGTPAAGGRRTARERTAGVRTATPPALRPRRLVGLASILVDVGLAVPYVPASGHDVLATPVGTAAGGGLNTLVAAARLGLPAVYAARHGTGPMGDLVRAALAADGVGALLPATSAGDTGWCLALVEPHGERTFVTVGGVEAALASDDLQGLVPGPDDAVLVSGYDLAYPGSRAALAAWIAALPSAADGGPLLVVDPGPLAAEVPRPVLDAVLRRTDLLSTSGGDLIALGGESLVLPRLRPGAVVVVRSGAAGCVVRTVGAAGRLAVPAATPPGPVVDTNGAGDAHLGALLAALSGGAAWPVALQTANAAAAWCVTRHGAASGPTRAEIAEVLPASGSPQGADGLPLHSAAGPADEGGENLTGDR